MRNMQQPDIMSRNKSFWPLAGYFWTEEHVHRWRTVLSNDAGTDTLANLVCLSPELRRAMVWSRLALRPESLSNDGKKLTVSMHWLPPPVPGKVPVTQQPDFRTAADGSGEGPEKITVFDRERGRLIRSGDLFKFTTTDPFNYPLPSFDLLEMHWIMQRAANIRYRKHHEEYDRDRAVQRNSL